MLDFAGADAKRQGPEGSMGRCVAVAAYYCRSRLRDAEFGPDDMDYTLIRAIQPVQPNPKLTSIPV